MTERVSFSAPAVKRAIATVEKAGKSIAGVDFPPEGGFRLLLGEPREADVPDRSGGDWEVVPL